MRVLHASRSWDCDEVLEPGDMLYLPPNVAHWGEAVDDCFTYSIGFLAPSHDAIVQNFMAYFAQVLEGRVHVDSLYADADLTAPRDALAVDDAMIARLERILRATRFTKNDVADFAGRYFTGPKPSARFSPPSRAPSLASFAQRLRATKGSLALALPSRGLVRGRRVFLNGDAIDVDDAAWLRDLTRLIRERSVSLPIGERTIDEDLLGALHAWLCAGWLGFWRP
jgi:50S ribosomal protein L16 3-hydroxylase